MHGKGEFYWPEGAFYSGVYEKNKKSGQGKLVLKEGRKIEGEWKEGILIDVE